MPSTFSSLALPSSLALLVVLGCIVAAFVLVRAQDRRQRRHARQGARNLTRLLSRYLEDQASRAELRRAVRAAGAGPFWTALETFSLRLGRREWLWLSRALERNHHSIEERRALADDSPWRRSLAARRLALLRSRASWRALRRALTRGPEMVTLAAANALARYRDHGALRWLLAHPGALGRRTHQSLAALLRAFGPGALPELALALERGLDATRLERAVIDTLGLARYRAARAAVERRLRSDQLDLRVAAARALGRLEAVESGTMLLAALKDEAWQVRAHAARALGQVQAPIAIPALAKLLTDRAWWVRRHAAYALVELGEDGQRALRDVSEASPDPYARDMAREALDGGPRLRIA